MLENAVPTDQFAVLDGEFLDEVELMLPPGEYIIHIQSADDTITLSDTILIAATGKPPN